MVLERRWGQRRLLLAFENSSFNYLVICKDDAKIILWEGEAKPHKYFQLNYVIQSALENGVAFIYRSKTNVLSL